MRARGWDVDVQSAMNEHRWTMSDSFWWEQWNKSGTNPFAPSPTYIHILADKRPYFSMSDLPIPSVSRMWMWWAIPTETGPSEEGQPCLITNVKPRWHLAQLISWGKHTANDQFYSRHGSGTQLILGHQIHWQCCGFPHLRPYRMQFLHQSFTSIIWCI